LLTLVAAYIGIYLCRKNVSVAVPILQQQWGLTKEAVGLVASVGTVVYAAGKFFWGPITDKVGGRPMLFSSMAGVALFGFASALSPGLLALVILHSLNRLFGAACWGAMIKVVPNWFTEKRLPFACGVLSLSFVFGGALAVAFAGMVAHLSHDSVFSILAAPSAALLGLLALGWAVLPGNLRGAKKGDDESGTSFSFSQATRLFVDGKFLIILGLSFSLTMLRETFNFWTVDFVRTEGGPAVTNAVAAYISTPFDVCGGAGIILIGWLFGKLGPAGRRKLLIGNLVALSAVLLFLPWFFSGGLWVLAASVGAIGFLIYGPYSLLGGLFSVEVRGKEMAATVAGMVDGTGYIAGFLSGVVFGKIIALGGYRLGFEMMAGLTVLAACLCFFLYRDKTPRVGTCESALPAGPELRR